MISPNKKNLLMFVFIAAAVAMFLAGNTLATEKKRTGSDLLHDEYKRIEPRLWQNSFGMPLYLESSDESGKMHVDIYGVFEHNFASVVRMISVPANWCNIASLHPNVKACIHRENAGEWELTFYGGRKSSQSLDGTHQFTFKYRNVEQRQGYLNIALSADEGPLGTKDHRIRLEALPLDGARTFIHMSCTHSYGFALQLVEKLYFATLGKGKVGFTVNGTDSSGNPVYVGGSRGAIERNAVRYYLAIQAFMDTLNYPEESRFNMRLSKWYDLSERYKKQLFDLDRKDYLAFKTAQYRNQIILQRQISAQPK
jgi:hypothetical protein